MCAPASLAASPACCCSAALASPAVGMQCNIVSRVLSWPVHLSCTVQVKLQDMRAKLPDLVDPKPPEQEQQAGDAECGQQQDQQQHGVTSQPTRQQQQQGVGRDDIDDDELLELQAQPMVRSFLVWRVQQTGRTWIAKAAPCCTVQCQAGWPLKVGAQTEAGC